MRTILKVKQKLILQKANKINERNVLNITRRNVRNHQKENLNCRKIIYFITDYFIRSPIVSFEM
jgi:hypothetical protein